MAVNMIRYFEIKIEIKSTKYGGKMMIQQEVIQGHVVEFNPINHSYKVDGVDVLSVSQLCKLANPKMYQGVDQNVLTRAAHKGSMLHDQIEKYENHGIESNAIEFKNYLRVKDRLGFKKEMTERMVIVKSRNKVICAGRFDLLATMDQERVLMDFKRTSHIHLDYVRLQLNLYRLGIMQSYGIDVTKLMLIRLRDYEVNVLEVDINETDTLNKILSLVT